MPPVKINYRMPPTSVGSSRTCSAGSQACVMPHEETGLNSRLPTNPARLSPLLPLLLSRTVISNSTSSRMGISLALQSSALFVGPVRAIHCQDHWRKAGAVTI